jgi:tetratricopeptide (TPR) repeat protein
VRECLGIETVPLNVCDVLMHRCVLELHAIAVKKAEEGGDFAVAMTAEERLRFLRGIKADYKEYYKMLGTVNAEASNCSRPADRIRIHESIRCSVGFGKLSRMVFGVLEGWMEGQLRDKVASCEGAGKKEEAMEWNHALAKVLMQQGRHTEALAIFESLLHVYQRSLSEIHLGKGDYSLRSVALIGEAAAVMDNLSMAYLELGRHADALAMGEKSLESLRCVLPENHPILGKIELCGAA